MRTFSADVVKKEGEAIEMLGWVQARRDHGKHVFIDIRDRSGIVQVVFPAGGGAAPGGGPAIAQAGALRLGGIFKII